MDERTVQLHPSWLAALGDEFKKPYMQQLGQFLRDEKSSGKTIYPAGDNIFNALNSVPFDSVRVVVLGQDPYHGPGQAHGLCFSVAEGVAPPPSLVNIFKELQRDLQLPYPPHGCLSRWASQGVLLLNSVLTVEHKCAGSHAGRGWEQFTDRIIEQLNQQREGLVFLLWGAYAQKKGQFIDADKHLPLKSPHPSPLSAYRGFIGNGHFSKANAYLQARGQAAIDWSL